MPGSGFGFLRRSVTLARGLALTACSIWLLGGITLLGMGIIGEYIGKIYTEVKRRPRYLIREILNDPEQTTHD